MHVETGSRRNEVAQDDVLLETDEPVDSAGQCGLRQHLGGFLETGCGNETFALNGCLGDPEQLRRGGGGLRFVEGGWSLSGRLDLSVDFFDRRQGDDVAFVEFRISRGSDSPAFPQSLIDSLKFKFVDEDSRKQVRAADVRNGDFAKHLGDDDFDMFVVDFNTLRSIDVLDFVLQVLLNGFSSTNAEDVVRHEWAANQRVPSLHEILGMHEQLLTVRDDVFDFRAVFTANDDDALAAFLFG